MEDGWTSLHLACYYREHEAVHFLIGQGADIHVTDNDSSNPVHLASEDGHLNVVQLLINIGVNINI
jgi:ankyrin repeat protein